VYIYPLGPGFGVTEAVAPSALGLTPRPGPIECPSGNWLESLDKARLGSAVNVKTEAKMNMREGIFAQHMKAELEREKSRMGRIRPLPRGTSIKPLLSPAYNVSSVLLRYRQVWSPYYPIQAGNILQKEIPLQQASHA
jgi:hypothetical protein